MFLERHQVKYILDYGVYMFARRIKACEMHRKAVSDLQTGYANKGLI